MHHQTYSPKQHYLTYSASALSDLFSNIIFKPIQPQNRRSEHRLMQIYIRTNAE
jgi:hypothetical protein